LYLNKLTEDDLEPGVQPRFLRGGGLKEEKFCDVILMTYFRWRNL